MAFVYKSRRNISQQEVQNSKIGPGSYSIQIDYKFKRSIVPFLSTSQKEFSQDKTQKDIPGPGHYNNDSNSIQGTTEQTTHKLFQHHQQSNSIENASSSNFKSGTLRFIQISEDNIPGPGSYYNNNNQKSLQHIKDKLHKGLRASSEQLNLLQQNQYQKVASIPNVKSEFKDFENNNLSSKQNIQLMDIQNSDSQGNQSKGIKWIKSNQNRFSYEKIATTNLIGPGSYNPEFQVSFSHQTNQSHNFASKVERQYEPLKSKQKLFKGSRSNLSTNATLNNKVDSEESEDYEQEQQEEYLKGATPGPGYYHNDKSTTLNISSKPTKVQQFGISSKRFEQIRKTDEVGPGQYFVEDKSQNALSNNKVKAPFQSQKPCFEKEQVVSEIPGPGQYQLHYSLENKQAKKMLKAPKGYFGIKETRFEPLEIGDLPGPGTYSDANIHNSTDKSKNLMSSQFASNIFRNLFENKEAQMVPSVGIYEIDQHTIAKKFSKKAIEDIYRGDVKQPPFLSQIPRFKEQAEIPEEGIIKQPKEYIYINQLEEDQQNISKQKEYKFKMDNNFNQDTKIRRPFLSNVERFIKPKVDEVPGPGLYYSPKQQSWNKRTYNIHFSEV